MRPTACLTTTLLALVVLAGSARAEPPQWEVDPARSRIGIAFSQLGATVEGVFRRFEATIRFDPAAATGAIVAIIDTGSFDTGDADRDAMARTPAFLAVDDHPDATFRASDIRGGGGRFTARGTLTIKGVERPVLLPFALSVAAGVATAEGSVEISRRDYGIGTATADIDAVLGDAVTITLRITARRND